MLQKEIVKILTFFDVWGYCTGFSVLSNSRKGQFILIFVHILFATTFMLCEYVVIIELSATMGILDMINEIIQYTAALYTYWLIILDSFLYRQAHKVFWEILQRIDDCFCSQYIHLRSYLWCFIEYVLISNILYLLVYLSNVFASKSATIVFVITISIWQIRISYYVLCLNVVNYQLKTIDNEISMMKCMLNVVRERKYCRLNVSKTSTFHLFESKRIKWIQEYYFCVSTMIELLNTIFGWSQAAIILFCFFSFITDLNWFYSIFDQFTLTKIICKYFHNVIEINYKSFTHFLLTFQ